MIYIINLYLNIQPDFWNFILQLVCDKWNDDAQDKEAKKFGFFV